MNTTFLLINWSKKKFDKVNIICRNGKHVIALVKVDYTIFYSNFHKLMRCSQNPHRLNNLIIY